MKNRYLILVIISIVFGHSAFASNTNHGHDDHRNYKQDITPFIK